MLAAADTFTDRHTDAIPGLALLFRPDALAELIRQHTGDAARGLVLEPSYIRFKPGSSCLVAYQGQSVETRFHCCAKAISLDNAVKLDKFRRRPTVAGPLGPGRLVFDQHLLVVWFFPNDNALRSLRRYLAEQSDICTLAYKPERRFVGLMRGSSGEHQVLKIYKASAFQRARELAAIADDIECLPNLAGIDVARHALRLHWMEGETLSEKLCQGGDTRPYGEIAGAQLARLHHLPLPSGLQRHDAKHDRRRLQGLAAGLAAACPEYSPLVERIADGLYAGLQQQSSRPVLAHGDFYAKQVLFTDAGPRLLDFDELSAAPAEGDIGQFLAHLQFDVLRRRLSPTSCDRLADAFVQGYSRQREADLHLIELYTLYGMFQLAHRPFRDQMADWPRRTLAWLERIALRLGTWSATAGLGRTPATPSHQPSKLTSLLERALDARGYAAVGGVLATLDAPYHQLQVYGATELRQKPGRRALVRYELVDGERQQRHWILGKIRAKGLDKRTFEHNVRLHELTTEAAAETPLRIPRPLGALPEMDMWLQEWVEGQDGWQALGAPDCEGAAVDIARALHQLHRLSGPIEKTHSWRDELTLLAQRLPAAAAAVSAPRPRLERLLQQCELIAGHLEDRPTCGIHRDFYPDQVLLAGEQVFVLDLDLHCQGDPAVDIGNFIAHIQEMDLRTAGDPFRHHDFYDRFALTYYDRSPDRDLPFAVEVYRLLTLARHVHISSQFDDRRPYSLDILAFCEQGILQLLEQTPITKRTHEINP